MEKQSPITQQSTKTNQMVKGNSQILRRPYGINKQNNESENPFRIFTLTKITNTTQVITELNSGNINRLNQHNNNLRYIISSFSH